MAGEAGDGNASVPSFRLVNLGRLMKVAGGAARWGIAELAGFGLGAACSAACCCCFRLRLSMLANGSAADLRFVVGWDEWDERCVAEGDQEEKAEEVGSSSAGGAFTDWLALFWAALDGKLFAGLPLLLLCVVVVVVSPLDKSDEWMLKSSGLTWE
jgi:hypothetical protein